MKLFTSKALRARFSECAGVAEREIVYIERPGGRLLQLTIVPDGDVQQIRNLLVERKERNLKK